MLRFLVIFSLFFVAIRASGEFLVLSSPSSLQFEGKDGLQSEYVGDVLNIAVGNPIVGGGEWAGMTVNDPFNLASRVIAVLVDGVKNINVVAAAKKFDLKGSSADDSLNTLATELEASNVEVCDINFNDFEDGVSNFHACFGNISPVSARRAVQLKPLLHSADKEFLETISLIDTAAENLSNVEKNVKFLFVRLSLESIGKAHGEKSEAMKEAIELVSGAIAKLNAAAGALRNDNVLFVAIANKNVGGRSKREVITGTPGKNDYNLAEYYNQDYPVIFNIILWFMVAFGFALLAICYAIGTMDPGRDSIIYRMTSTRMKKDN